MRLASAVDRPNGYLRHCSLCHYRQRNCNFASQFSDRGKRRCIFFAFTRDSMVVTGANIESEVRSSTIWQESWSHPKRSDSCNFFFGVMQASDVVTLLAIACTWLDVSPRGMNQVSADRHTAFWTLRAYAVGLRSMRIVIPTVLLSLMYILLVIVRAPLSSRLLHSLTNVAKHFDVRVHLASTDGACIYFAKGGLHQYVNNRHPRASLTPRRRTSPLHLTDNYVLTSPSCLAQCGEDRCRSFRNAFHNNRGPIVAQDTEWSSTFTEASDFSELTVSGGRRADDTQRWYVFVGSISMRYAS